MTQTLVRSENQASVQEEIFRTLLRTPHRSVDQALEIHREQLDRDPYLYGKLATYAVHEGNSAVRDIQDVFVATLFTSEFLEHRHAAWVMLQDLAPFRVARVLKYVTGYSETITHTSVESPMAPSGQFGVTYKRACYGKSYHDESKRGQEIPDAVKPVSGELRKHLKTTNREMTVTKYHVNHACHAKWANRIVQSAVTNYLRFREREENQALMEGAILRARKFLALLYKKVRIRPSEWVEGVLFKNEAPEGSRIEAMKKLIAETDPVEQAKIIIEANLPYPVIKPLIQVTPSTQIASVQVMSPQELLANLQMLKRDGAFNIPELEEMIHAKLELVKTAKRGKVDAFKGDIAKDAGDLDETTKKLVSSITDTQLKQHGEIRVPTAVLVDKSASMTEAIEMGKRLGAAVAQAGGDNFKGMYLFGSNPQRVAWNASDGDITAYSAWDKKLKMVRADGGTDLGAAARLMLSDKVMAEQIVIVTDEGENGRPTFSTFLPQLKEQLGEMPRIIIVRLGRYTSDIVAKSCKAAGAEVDVLDSKEIDKISIPNILQILSKKSVFDLMQEILELSLPMKEEWLAKHPLTKSGRKTEAAMTT